MFKRKQYVYHVVYSYPMGNGTITIYRASKIKTVEDVKSVKRFIEENYGYKNVLITNWIKLKRSHVPDE